MNQSENRLVTESPIRVLWSNAHRTLEVGVVGSDVGTVYAGSDGRFYTDWQVERKLDTGEWKPCLYDREAGKRLVGVPGGDLLSLVRTEPANLPAWVRIRTDRAGPRAVDMRRVTPL